jgi:hypothetical protein
VDQTRLLSLACPLRTSRQRRLAECGIDTDTTALLSLQGKSHELLEVVEWLEMMKPSECMSQRTILVFASDEERAAQRAETTAAAAAAAAAGRSGQ